MNNVRRFESAVHDIGTKAVFVAGAGVIVGEDEGSVRLVVEEYTQRPPTRSQRELHDVEGECSPSSGRPLSELKSEDGGLGLVE